MSWLRGDGFFENDQNFNYVKDLFGDDKVKILPTNFTNESELINLKNEIEQYQRPTIMLNYINIMNFILGRDGREFQKGRMHKTVLGLEGNQTNITQTKHVIKKFNDFIKEKFENNALITDAFLTTPRG